MQRIRYAIAAGLATLGLLASACGGSKEEVKIPQYSNKNFLIMTLIKYPGDDRHTAGLFDYEVGNRHVLEVRQFTGYKKLNKVRPEDKFLGNARFDTICFYQEGRRPACFDFSDRTGEISTSSYNLYVVSLDRREEELYEFGLPYTVCLEDEVCYIDSDLDGKLDKKTSGNEKYKVENGKLVKVK